VAYAAAVEAYSRGLVLLEARRFRDAIECLDQAIDAFDRGMLEPDSRTRFAYFKRGCAKLELQQFEAAIPDFDRALELDPELVLAYAQRGRSKARLSHYAAAVEDFDAALALEKDPNDWSRDPLVDLALVDMQRGYSFEHLGRNAEAVAAFQQAIERGLSKELATRARKARDAIAGADT